MDAVVLVGGEGTRLRPLTYDTPKQMLPIIDRALVVHVVSWLESSGVGRVVLSLGYKPDAFVEAFPSGSIGGVSLAYATDPEPLDTAGAIKFAASEAGVEGRFVVLNGDVLTDQDLPALIRFHESHGAEASIALTPVEDPSSFGVVVTDASGLVSAFIEKPPAGTVPTNNINAGIYVLEPSVLDRIPESGRVSIEREVFPAVAADGSLFALPSEAYWLDTGTPAKYIEAQLDILHGRRHERTRPEAAETRPGCYVVEGAVVEGTIAGVAYLGRESVLGAEAIVRDSVVLEGCCVAEGARVEGSVLMAGARIGRACVIRDSIVGPGASVGAGASLAASTVVRGGSLVSEGAELQSERVGGP